MLNKGSLSIAVALAISLSSSVYIAGAAGPVSSDVSSDPTYRNEVSNSPVDGPGNIAVGQQNIVTSQYGSSSAFGNQNYVNGKDSIAFGEGNDVYGSLNSIDTSGRTPAVTKDGDGMATAFGDNNAVYGAQTSGYGSSNTVGEFSRHPINGQYDVEDKLPVKPADYSSAFGTNNTITGDHSLAAGFNNTVSGSYSAAIGSNSKASANNSIAVGTEATASHRDTIAVGRSATASGENSTAIGHETKATGERSVAFGNYAESSGYSSTAIGGSANASGKYAIATGNRANASGSRSIATGFSATAAGDSSIAAGHNANASRSNSIALGTESVANNRSAIAIGRSAQAAGENSTALGSNSQASAFSSVALGNTNNVSGESSAALGSNNTVSTNNSFAIGNQITMSQENSVVLGNASSDRAATTETTATVNGLTYSGFAGPGKADNGVVSIGATGAERQLIHVAAGKVASNSTDAINGSQLYAVANTVGNVAKSMSKALGGNTSVDQDGNITMNNIGGTGKNTIDDAIKASQTEVQAGKNVDVTKSTGNNGQPVYTVGVKDDLSLNSVTTGNTVMNNNGITTGHTVINSGGVTVGGNTYVSSDGLNANGQKITNVANGDVSATSTDAVNGSQLYQATSQVGGRLNHLDSRINKVGAGAAALAALHPLDFDPDDKWNFALGYGNYRNANAMAIGAFYRPNEDTMFSVAGSMGNGENMINAGVSLKLGQRSNVTNSKVAMAKEIQELKLQLAAQDEKINQLMSGRTAASLNLDVNFPDVDENHWAYGYVKSLADRGLLVGYPDGNFHGDRTMTRYEFAAIIYRALENGATMDANMTRAIDEFGPELERIQKASRFRVDRVSGNDNDRHKIERVRVNNENDKANHEYRDVYGGLITPTRS